MNYLVLVLAILLLDDSYLLAIVPRGMRTGLPTAREPAKIAGWRWVPAGAAAFLLCWVLYAATVPLVKMFWMQAPLPEGAVTALEPFRIANEYGLFAVMTPHRFEIEFQGSNNGKTWTAYPFRFKPQDPARAPGIYAPYQPRFDWNLWFASLGTAEENPMVVRTEVFLLQGRKPVLGLFAADPFHGTPPRMIRTVLWQYWFSTREDKKTQGVWWRRQLLGPYGPTLMRLPDGSVVVVPESEQGSPQT